MSTWVNAGNGLEINTGCYQMRPCLHSIRIGGVVQHNVPENEIPHGNRLNDGKKVLIGHNIITGDAYYGQRCPIFGCGGLIPKN